MEVLQTLIFGILITSTYGQISAIFKSPNDTMWKNTTKFEIGINEKVNSPKFSTFIRFCNSTTNASVCNIDSANDSLVDYNGTNITFNAENCAEWSINDTYYITFDEGVFYSNDTSNSSEINNSSFWSLRVIEAPTTTSTTTTTTTTTAEITRTFLIGEPPPTRSAKLGMGLGISFIGVLLIGEIVYFKTCYRGGPRNRHYAGEIIS